MTGLVAMIDNPKFRDPNADPQQVEALLHFAAIVESSADAILGTDRDGIILACNPGTRTLFGYSPAELIGQSVSMLAPPELRDEPARLNRKILAGELISDHETIRLRKDGSRIDVSLTLSPLRNLNGVIIGTSSITRDITDRKRMERELKVSERRYRELIESSQGLICIHNLQGVLLTINPAAATHLGYQIDEMVGRNLSEFLTPRAQPLFSGYLDRVRQKGSDSGLMEIQASDGNRRVWMYHNVLSQDAATGPYVLGHALDVTERLLAEKRLQIQYATTRILVESSTLEEASREILRTICEGLKWDLGSIWKVDPHANVLRCVEVWHHASFQTEEIRERAHSSTFAPGVGLAGRVWSERKSIWIPDIGSEGRFPQPPIALKYGMRGAFGFPIIVGDRLLGVIEFFSGRIRPPDSTLVEMFAALGGQIGQFMDRKNLEQQFRQAQKLEAIGTMAAGIAHNFGNLMTAILGYSELALEKLTENLPVKEDIEEIRRTGKRATALTEQLLAFSRKQARVSQILNLNQIVASMDRMLRPIIANRVEVVIVLDPELPMVKADPGQVEEVILNLVVNARDAMPGGGRLFLTTRKVELGRWHEELGETVAGTYGMLEVGDTGVGMDAETRKRIFEPFFTTKAPGKGTGLGLSTVYGIVRQSGGYIAVFTGPQQGTRFQIYLPRGD